MKIRLLAIISFCIIKIFLAKGYLNLTPPNRLRDGTVPTKLKQGVFSNALENNTVKTHDVDTILHSNRKEDTTSKKKNSQLLNSGNPTVNEIGQPIVSASATTAADGSDEQTAIKTNLYNTFSIASPDSVNKQISGAEELDIIRDIIVEAGTDQQHTAGVKAHHSVKPIPSLFNDPSKSNANFSPNDEVDIILDEIQELPNDSNTVKRVSLPSANTGQRSSNHISQVIGAFPISNNLDITQDTIVTKQPTTISTTPTNVFEQPSPDPQSHLNRLDTSNDELDIINDLIIENTTEPNFIQHPPPQDISLDKSTFAVTQTPTSRDSNYHLNYSISYLEQNPVDNDFVNLHTNNVSELLQSDIKKTTNPAFQQIKKIRSHVNQPTLNKDMNQHSALPIQSNLDYTQHNKLPVPIADIKLKRHDEIPVTSSSHIPQLDREESLKDYYEEWVQFMIEEMYGAKWANENPFIRKTDICSNNKKLKNRGCALLVPTCLNHTATEDSSNHWACEISLWRGCTCSLPYTSFLKYLIPRKSECYGEVMHSNDLTELLDLPSTSDPLLDASNLLLIPTGYCGLSGFFVVYILMMFSLFIGLFSMIKGVLFKATFSVKKLYQPKRIKSSHTLGDRITSHSKSGTIVSTSLKDN